MINRGIWLWYYTVSYHDIPWHYSIIVVTVVVVFRVRHLAAFITQWPVDIVAGMDVSLKK